jgi:hypothetical protein
MSTDTLACARCGYIRSAGGPLLAEDGTELTAQEYLDLLRMVGGELICERCTRPGDEAIGTLS